jgi:hypothetical protein
MTGWTACRYGAGDERVQDPQGDSLHNDSTYLHFVTRRRQGPLGAILRVGLRPGAGHAECHLHLPMADGSTIYWTERAPLELTVGAGVWAGGGLELAVVDPTIRWRVRYEGDGTRRIADPGALRHLGRALKASPPVACSLDLTFDAGFPLHVMQETGEMIPGQAAARHHYEQFGAVSGTIEVDGVLHHVEDAPAFRDHSWGPRDYVAVMGDMDWLTAMLDDGSRFVAFRIHSRADLPVQGARVDAGGVRFLDRVEVDTDWRGGTELLEPVELVLGTGGDVVRMRATPLRSALIRHRSPAGLVHNTFVQVELDGPLGPGEGWLDLNRPAPEAS